jgi:hypothetical protein
MHDGFLLFLVGLMAVGLMNNWYVYFINESDMLLVDNWLNVFMDVLFNDNWLMMLMNHLLMVLMDNIL